MDMPLFPAPSFPMCSYLELHLRDIEQFMSGNLYLSYVRYNEI